MVRFSDLPAAIQQAFDRITPLSFAIVGKSLDGGEPWAAGSGVFIAPYIALTAKHVVEGTWKQFEPDWKKNKLPKAKERSTHFLVLTQKLRAGSDEEATWIVEEAWPLAYTDLAILRVTPQNDIAKAYQWGRGFLELQLLPPAPGSDVYVFGYPESHAVNDAEREDGITGDFQIKVFPAKVTKIEDFRRDRSLSNFPGFEFTPGVEGGASGGPIFVENRLCGIVSIGGIGENPNVAYAAALWPLVFRAIRFGVGEPATILDLLKGRMLRGVNVEEVERRAYLDDVDDGGLDGPKQYARLRP